MKKLSMMWCVTMAMFFSVVNATEQTIVDDPVQEDLRPGTATYSGRATALGLNILGSQTNLSDTGALPSQGGALEASLLETSLPLSNLGSIGLEVLHATAIGQGNYSASESSVAGLNLSVGLNTISAALLTSRASVSCQNAPAGKGEVVSLVVNGTPIVITGQPNQTVNLIAGVLIINEQSSTANSIKVNALRISVLNGVDIVLAQASAGITCNGTPSCKGNDFITGGGYVTVGSNQKGNFGVAGGNKNNGTWGHLTFIDHNTGMKVHGTGVSSYKLIDATTRRITGTARINNSSGFTYIVTVSDRGEPGVNDSFRLQLSNGYDTTVKSLSGGNIQLHTPCK